MRAKMYLGVDLDCVLGVLSGSWILERFQSREILSQSDKLYVCVQNNKAGLSGLGRKEELI